MMEHVQKGGSIKASITTTRNKGLSRLWGEINLTDKSGRLIDGKEIFAYGGGATIETFMQEIFPWAKCEGNEEAYKKSLEPDWEADCVNYDDEGRRHVSESFDEWYQNRKKPPLFPVMQSGGEHEDYDLTLNLNALGKAFLKLNAFLNQHP